MVVSVGIHHILSDFLFFQLCPVIVLCITEKFCFCQGISGPVLSRGNYFTDRNYTSDEWNTLKENVSKSKMAPAVCSTPRAAAVAELGAKKWREGKAINADDHRPIYLKKSQAEQEREAGIYTKGSLRPGESGTQAKIC